jgi:hypothetical protein
MGLGCIIPYFEQLLQPVVKPSCGLDLVDHKVYHIQVIIVEDNFLFFSFDLEVVVAIFKKPSLFGNELEPLDVVEVNYVVRSMGKFVCVLVGN